MFYLYVDPSTGVFQRDCCKGLLRARDVNYIEEKIMHEYGERVKITQRSWMLYFLSMAATDSSDMKLTSANVEWNQGRDSNLSRCG
jgi:hypothetical protein